MVTAYKDVLIKLVAHVHSINRSVTDVEFTFLNSTIPDPDTGGKQAVIRAWKPGTAEHDEQLGTPGIFVATDALDAWRSQGLVDVLRGQPENGATFMLTQAAVQAAGKM